MASPTATTDFDAFPVRVSQAHSGDRVNSISRDELHRYWRSQAGEGFLELHWPVEVDHDAWISAIRSILAKQMPQFADAEIKYFAEGHFNRLYSISKLEWPKAYLFRVSIPVDPFFKTESEVATMEYVRLCTSLPVPRVVAFSSSDDNDLGHEWVLAEMLDGVSLNKVWNTMPLTSKRRFIAELAGRAKELLSLRFSKFGNIYFADIADRVVSREADGGNTDPVNPDFFGPGGSFVIGRMVSHDFFNEKRVLLPNSRGPFQTTRELIDARVDLLGKRIHNLSAHPEDKYYCVNDAELARNKERVYQVFDQLKAVVPLFVPHENGPEDMAVLWHDDLSQHNLLVDPVTYKLTGVIDWESVSILPAYETYNAVPSFLSDRDYRPTPLVLLARGVTYNDSAIAAEIADREAKLGLIRREYHKIVGLLYDDTSDETCRRVAGKRGLAKQLELASFQHRPWATAAWLAEYGFGQEVNDGTVHNKDAGAAAEQLKEHGANNGMTVEIPDVKKNGANGSEGPTVKDQGANGSEGPGLKMRGTDDSDTLGIQGKGTNGSGGPDLKEQCANGLQMPEMQSGGI